MQRGADPIARSERLANAATVALIEGKPLPQFKFTEVLRKFMATNIGRLKCAHGGSPTGFTPAYEATPKTACRKSYPQESAPNGTFGQTPFDPAAPRTHRRRGRRRTSRALKSRDTR